MNSKGNMKQTAVEWIEQQLIEGTMRPVEIIAIAKAMEKEEIHKRQLMLGKVSELIGFEKTVELWKECIESIVTGKQIGRAHV